MCNKPAWSSARAFSILGRGSEELCAERGFVLGVIPGVEYVLEPHALTSSSKQRAINILGRTILSILCLLIFYQFRHKSQRGQHYIWGETYAKGMKTQRQVKCGC